MTSLIFAVIARALLEACGNICLEAMVGDRKIVGVTMPTLDVVKTTSSILTSSTSSLTGSSMKSRRSWYRWTCGRDHTPSLLAVSCCAARPRGSGRQSEFSYLHNAGVLGLSLRDLDKRLQDRGTDLVLAQSVSLWICSSRSCALRVKMRGLIVTT